MNETTRSIKQNLLRILSEASDLNDIDFSDNGGTDTKQPEETDTLTDKQRGVIAAYMFHHVQTGEMPSYEEVEAYTGLEGSEVSEVLSRLHDIGVYTPDEAEPMGTDADIESQIPLFRPWENP